MGFSNLPTGGYRPALEKPGGVWGVWPKLRGWRVARGWGFRQAGEGARKCRQEYAAGCKKRCSSNAPPERRGLRKIGGLSPHGFAGKIPSAAKAVSISVWRRAGLKPRPLQSGHIAAEDLPWCVAAMGQASRGECAWGLDRCRRAARPVSWAWKSGAGSLVRVVGVRR